MATNKYYMVAGLQPSKDGDVSPTSQINTYYMVAGLPKIFVASAPGGTTPERTKVGAGS